MILIKKSRIMFSIDSTPILNNYLKYQTESESSKLIWDENHRVSILRL